MVLGNISFLTDVETGKDVSLSLDSLTEERELISANSGGGKSYLLRSKLEHSKGKIHQIIMSPKDEFASLKEKFRYVHVGKSREDKPVDIELNIRYAKKLCEKILETNSDAIIDLSGFPSSERKQFYKEFIDFALEAPQSLWHPVLFVLDEAHEAAPESKSGESISLGSVAELASRGRDMGYALVCATQRLSKFHKDVAAELNIKFIGRSTLDTDKKRAGSEIGLSPKDYDILTTLGRPNFHFFAYGSGLSDDVIRVKAKQVQTTHLPGWQRAKKKYDVKKATNVNDLVNQFKDLPVQAEKELRTLNDYKKKTDEQKREINRLNRLINNQKPVVDESKLKQAEEKGYKKAVAEYQNYMKKMQGNLSKLKNALQKIAQIASDSVSIEIPKLEVSNQPSKIEPKAFENTKPTLPTPTTETKQSNGNSTLNASEKKILTAIVQRPDHTATRAQVALVSGYSQTSGGFKNYLSKLRSNGFIEYQGQGLVATQKGIDELGNDYEPLPMDNDSVQQFWFSKLPNSPAKILKAICEAYPNPISREDVAEKTNYSVTSGGFKNYLSHLRTTGLINYVGDGQLRATEELFPEDL